MAEISRKTIRKLGEMKMKLSRKVSILFVFVLVAGVAITATTIFARNKVQSATILADNEESKQVNQQKKIEEQKKLEIQKKIDEQKKLEDQKKAEAQKKLELQKQQAEKDKEQKATVQKQTSPSKLVQPVQDSSLLINKIKGKGNAQQAIVVTTSSLGEVNATITTFEKINGIWRKVTSFTGNIGKNGFTYNKVEGDGKSPIGTFSLGTAFGRYTSPGTAMNYRRSTLNSFWVDDVNSALYNTWQEGPASGRWGSAENMYIPQYNYGFVINYNTTQRIPGKGSAIFFHVWSGAGHGTAGCTAAAQGNVISVLKWLNPSKNPIIIQGPMSEVVK